MSVPYLSMAYFRKWRLSLGTLGNYYAPVSSGANSSLSTDEVVPLVNDRAAGTYVSNDIGNRDFLGAHIIVTITAMDAATTLDVAIQGKNESTGLYYDLLVATTINTPPSFLDISVFKIYPGINPIPGGSVSDFLPNVWRISAVTAGGNTTFSIAANMAK